MPLRHRLALLILVAGYLAAQPLPPRAFDRLEPAPNNATRRALRPAYRAALAEALFDPSSVAHFLTAQRSGKPVRLRFNVAPGLDLPVSIQNAQFWPESASVSWTGTVDTTLPGSFSLAITDGQLNGYLATGAGRIFDLSGTVNQAEITEVDPASFRLECPSPNQPQDQAAESLLPERQLPGPASILDVLVVYSAAARTAAGSVTAIENQIRETVAFTNQAYANTGLALRINLVGTREVTYTENGSCSTALDRITNPNDGVMDDVPALRDQTGADLVSLWVNRGDCGGIAWIMSTNDQSFARNAYSVTITESPTFWRNISFAHELGHNMGSAHDRANANQGLFSYSFGYQSTEAQPFFRDIMAYQCANADCPTQPYFSSPDVLVLGRPIGLPASNPQSADAAQTFTLSAPTIESFRPRGGTSVPLVLGPPTRSVPAAGGPFSVSITTSAPWQAVSQASWITGLSPASGSGNATLNYQVAPNGSGALRRGSIQIGGTTHIVEQAFTISCSTAPITLGTATSASLSANSCTSPLRGNTRAARYSFAGVAGQQIAVQLSSSAFDTYLYLVRPDGTVLAEDDDSGGATNSRIPAGTGLITLPSTGTYLIEATAFDATATGAFTLSTILPTTVACTYSINPTTLTEAALAAQRNIAVSTAAGCNWTAVSQASWIAVASNSSGAGNADVRLDIAANNTAAPRSGTVLIAGRTLTVNQAALTNCAPSPLTVGVTVSGTLSAANPCRSTFRPPGTFAARYTFAGTIGQTVQIVLEAPSLDTYLYLLDPTGNILAEDDDAAGNLNSAIPNSTGLLTLPATGTYTIEATTFPSAAEGTFTLKLLNSAPGYLALLHNTPSTLLLPSGTTAQLYTTASLSRQITVPVGATRLEIRLRTQTPNVDIDLYVRRGTPPTVSSGTVLADYKGESLTGDETIVITPASNPPLQPGIYYVSLASFTPNVVISTTLTALLTPVPTPVVPTVTSTGPIFHTGATQTITLRFSHPAGIAELGILNALINRALDGGNACYIAFSQPLRVLYLVNNAGPDAGLSSPLTLGATGSVSNSQCTIFSAGSSVSSTNTELTLTLNIAFSSAFSGNRVIYLAARSVTEQNSGWQPQGVSALPEPTPPFPRANTLSPTTGSVANPTLTATFFDATNATNIQTTWLLINSAVNADRACYVAYFRPGNLLLLFPDNGDGNAATAMPLSGTGFLENSQCRINAQGSTVSIVGNALTLNLNTVFKPAFAGPRIVFGALNSSAVNSTWKPLGAWQVPP